MAYANRLKMSPEGPEVSRLVYGVWRLLEDPEGASESRVLTKIDTCLAHGITTFDHADIYGGYQCEAAFGRALKARPGLREKMEIVTKCGIMLVSPARPDNGIKHYNYTRQHIVSSAETSLLNLGTDYIDVLLLHRPSPLLHPDEVAAAAEELRRSGKVRHMGVSNFTPPQLSMLQSRMPVVTNQVEIHPLRVAPFLDGTLDQCLEQRFAPMAWSPTAGGRLFHGQGEVERRVRDALGRLCAKYQAGLDQLLYAWLLVHPARIIPVLGTNQPERIKAAAAALSIEMELQDWFAVWTAATGAEVP